MCFVKSYCNYFLVQSPWMNGGGQASFLWRLQKWGFSDVLLRADVFSNRNVQLSHWAAAQCEETDGTWRTDALAARWLCNPELQPRWHCAAVSAAERKPVLSTKTNVWLTAQGWTGQFGISATALLQLQLGTCFDFLLRGCGLDSDLQPQESRDQLLMCLQTLSQDILSVNSHVDHDKWWRQLGRDASVVVWTSCFLKRPAWPSHLAFGVNIWSFQFWWPHQTNENGESIVTYWLKGSSHSLVKVRLQTGYESIWNLIYSNLPLTFGVNDTSTFAFICS